MYNDTIKVANKIISDTDLEEIFQLMDEEIRKNTQISNQEKIQNEKYEDEYQNWTLKNFEGTFVCTFNFYDDTEIKVDNYRDFIIIFNNRLHEVKDMWVRYYYRYCIQHGKDKNYVDQSIYLNIYEHKMDITVNLSSADKKMDNIYQLIKEKILNSPERYDRVIKKKDYITNKVGFARGMIPSLVTFTLLGLVPGIRKVYGMTYVLFPILTTVFAYILGNLLFSGKLDSLYSTIVPNQKYAGWDSTNSKSIYKDDIDDYVSKSEIIIGKNIDNIQHRKEIVEIEEKYSKKIPTELIALLILSIIMILIGKLL